MSTNEEETKRDHRRTPPWMLVGLAILAAVWLFRALAGDRVTEAVTYTAFRQELEQGRIDEITIGEDRILYTVISTGEKGDTVRTARSVVPVEDPGLTAEILRRGIPLRGRTGAGDFLPTLLIWMLPILPLLLLWSIAARRMGGSQNILSVGKSKARDISGRMTGITFEEVGGMEEVEAELKEVIQFLREPARFTKLGARLPKGILLMGPPGTGKTLVAKAVAGEAGVPFFSISGSDFVELFVGVGAARVRDLFEQAKARAPCIIFIDEIDAVGQSRSVAGAIQANDEREQTLNQLLAEMDGFDPNQGVVIMGATNRPEVLDRALLRAGRFDRQVQIPLPTESGRRQILGIHVRAVPLAAGVDLDRIARITAGFSGADLANLVNEAALMAVRRDSTAVAMVDVDVAIERVVAGLQRKEPLDPETRERVAFHEGGHALVAALLPHTEPVHKVSIIPTARGALGYTLQMPDEDRYLSSRTELEERLCVMLGGRAAEMLIFAEPTTGAASDLERATDLARQMVTEFGMTAALGPVRYAPEAGYGYLGSRTVLRQDVSPETAASVDREVRRLIEEAQARASALLEINIAALREIARVLQEREVIDGAEIARIAHSCGHPPAPPEPGAGTHADGHGPRSVVRVPLLLRA